jgi:hypothetical protein
MAIHGLVKDSTASQSALRERYALLLVAILAAFAVQGIAPPGRFEQVIVSLLLTATVLLAGRAAGARPVVMRVMLAIGAAVLLASIASAIAGSVDSGAISLANLLLVVLAPPLVAIGVVRGMRRHNGVTVHAVYGVLCLYILLGMCFAFAYGAIDRFGSGPLFAGNVQATTSNCLYYSFTTLTTVGFGDITTITNLGHTLSSFEALGGQIYLVTVVALIVSNLRRPDPSES